MLLKIIDFAEGEQYLVNNAPKENICIAPGTYRSHIPLANTILLGSLLSSCSEEEKYEVLALSLIVYLFVVFMLINIVNKILDKVNLSNISKEVIPFAFKAAAGLISTLCLAIPGTFGLVGGIYYLIFGGFSPGICLLSIGIGTLGLYAWKKIFNRLEG